MKKDENGLQLKNIMPWVKKRYTNYVLDGAKESDMYGLCKKLPNVAGMEPWGAVVKSDDKQLLARVYPTWKTAVIFRKFGEQAAKTLDRGIVNAVIKKNTCPIMRFKTEITRKTILDVLEQGMMLQEPFEYADGAYYMVATNRKRIMALMNTGFFEDELFYQDKINRQLFFAETGRMIVSKGIGIDKPLYVMFLEVMDETEPAIMFAAGAITVPELEKNTSVKITGVTAEDVENRSYLWWKTMIGAEVDTSKCTVLMEGKKK